MKVISLTHNKNADISGPCFIFPKKLFIEPIYLFMRAFIHGQYRCVHVLQSE